MVISAEATIVVSISEHKLLNYTRGVIYSNELRMNQKLCGNCGECYQFDPIFTAIIILIVIYSSPLLLNSTLAMNLLIQQQLNSAPKLRQ